MEECLFENTKVLVPIEDIIIDEENIVHFKVASIIIRASNKHLFIVIRKGQKEVLKASDLLSGDLLEAYISSLSPGNKVIGSDGEFHEIVQNYKKKL